MREKFRGRQADKNFPSWCFEILKKKNTKIAWKIKNFKKNTLEVAPRKAFFIIFTFKPDCPKNPLDDIIKQTFTLRHLQLVPIERQRTK